MLWSSLLLSNIFLVIHTCSFVQSYNYFIIQREVFRDRQRQRFQADILYMWLQWIPKRFNWHLLWSEKNWQAIQLWPTSSLLSFPAKLNSHTVTRHPRKSSILSLCHGWTHNNVFCKITCCRILTRYNRTR